MANNVVILGAGPAGLTAGYAAVKKSLVPLILEQDVQVGGISKTVDYKGCLFDIGGHRFFTKFAEIQDIWDELLGQEFLVRPRLSRIYYRNRYFDYPLKPANALSNLGLGESVRVVLSYVAGQIRSSKDIRTFEDWVSKKFGRRLFRIFFQTYTEKVWGISCRELRSDWAAQRIRSLSLPKAVLDSFGLVKNGNVTTLIDRFHYPETGPGLMWKKAKEFIEARGGIVELGSKVTRIRHEAGKVFAVEIVSPKGRTEVSGETFISSLPLKDLLLALDPEPPGKILEAARRLRYRDFFTVGLIIRKRDIFPDNWIYIHSPDIRVGRIQNFKNWSPRMVPDDMLTTLGLEYFCFETEDLWKAPDLSLIDMAIKETGNLGLAARSQIVDGTVIRSRKAYPIYDAGYAENVRIIREYLATYSNLQSIGRNGLHRYNNQDHSMMTALYAVGNITGEYRSVWDVNAEEGYHESS